MSKGVELEMSIKVDTKLYPLEAVHATACVFIDKVYIYLSEYKDGIVTIEFSAKEGTKKKELDSIKGEFMNELLNFLHRINIAKNNKKVREHMVHRALFSSIGDSLLSDDDDDDEVDSLIDDSDDPLGIKNSWDK